MKKLPCRSVAILVQTQIKIEVQVLPEAMSAAAEVEVEKKKVARGPVLTAAQKLKEDVEGAWWSLKWMLEDLMWAIVVAAVMQYFAGHGGDANHFIMSVFLLRALKLPEEILHCMKSEIGGTLKESLAKLNYMERRDMKANYLSEDIVRQVKTALEKYEPSLKNKRWPYEAFSWRAL